VNGGDLAVPELLILLAGALGIAWWASRRVAGGLDWHTARGALTPWQSGLALGGDVVTLAVLAAVTVLGVPGLGSPVLLAGALIGLVLALIVLAEPLRNSGRTIPAVLARRFGGRSARTTAAAVTVVVCGLLAVACLVAAGALVRLLYGAAEPVLGFPVDVLAIAGIALAAAAVTGAGGLLAASWTAVVRTVLLAGGLALLAGAAGSGVVASLLRQTAGDAGAGGAELLSLGLAVVLGVAVLPSMLGGLPGLAPGAPVRTGLRWAIGTGLTLTLLAVPVAVNGAAITPDHDPAPTAPPLAGAPGTFGGDVLLALLAVLVLLAVFALVAGLAVAAARALATDMDGAASDNGRARLAVAGTMTVVALAAVVLRDADAGGLIGVALAAAAAGLLPVALLTLYWPKLTSAGAVTGMVAGLGSTLLLAVLGAAGASPLHVPALLSVPVALVAAWAASVLTTAGDAAAPFAALRARAFTGQGAEVETTSSSVS
jgi:cation/acetate symporter